MTKAEDGGRRAEDGGQRTEDRGQRTEDGGQRAEDGGRRAEGGGQKAGEGRVQSKEGRGTRGMGEHDGRARLRPSRVLVSEIYSHFEHSSTCARIAVMAHSGFASRRIRRH